MSKKNRELIVETFLCKCGQNIRFLVMDEHAPLSDKQREILTNQKIFIVHKNQMLFCPNCEREIVIS